MKPIGDPIAIVPVLAPHRACNHYTFVERCTVKREPAVAPPVVVKGIGR